MRFLILCTLLICAALPAVAATTSEIVASISRLAAEGKQDALDEALEAARNRNKLDLLVELGRLHENLPNVQGLSSPDYPAAVSLYQQALVIAEEKSIENIWVQRARLYYARLLLTGRGGDRDVAKAVTLLKAASDQGHSAAAYAYAKVMERGFDDIAPDIKETEKWYRIAIRQGEGRAALALAGLVASGQLDTKENPENAARELRALGISLLKVAARSGDGAAAEALGQLYEKGEITQKNTKEALRWYESGAASGNIKAMLAAGRLLGSEAKGGEDKERATGFLRLAAKAGSSKAALELGSALLNGDEYYLVVPKDEALDWMERAAASGNAQAIDRLTRYYIESGQGYKVLDKLLVSAEEGRVSSMLALYRLYRDGSGVEMDTAKAKGFLDKARGSRNIEPAQLYQLSHYYQEQDDKETSAELLRKAASNSYAPALITLAEAYDSGRYGTEDKTEALRWYERAALHGSIRGMLRAGWYFSEGRGVAVDANKTKTYLEMALKKVGQKDYSGMTEIGIAYLKGRGFKKSDEDAFHWIERAAKGGEPRAMMQLSRLVRWGTVDEYTAAESMELLEKSAAQSYPNALQELAQLHAAGTHVPVNAPKAFEYFKEASALGKVESTRQVGLAYVNGEGVAKDIEKGLTYLKRAAAMNYGEAMLNLALLHRFPPQGMSKDEAAALEWIKKAAALGQADAQYLLGEAYREGKGVAKNADEARRWIEASAKQEHFQAERALATLKGEARY